MGKYPSRLCCCCDWDSGPVVTVVLWGGAAGVEYLCEELKVLGWDCWGCRSPFLTREYCARLIYIDEWVCL